MKTRLNKREFCKAVAAANPGMTCRYLSATSEYRVAFRNNEASAYYTNDADDAAATARAMFDEQYTRTTRQICGSAQTSRSDDSANVDRLSSLLDEFVNVRKSDAHAALATQTREQQRALVRAADYVFAVLNPDADLYRQINVPVEKKDAIDLIDTLSDNALIVVESIDASAYVSINLDFKRR